jgi:plastocyanin
VGSTKVKARPSPVSIPPSRRAQRYHQRQVQTRNRILTAISALLLVAGVVLVVSVAGGGGATPATTTPFVGSTVDVVLGDYSIAGNLTVPAGNVRLQAVNRGGIIHNVGIRGGPISGDLRPGGAFTIVLGSLVPGTYQLYCDIPDHVRLGMVANLVVT